MALASDDAWDDDFSVNSSLSSESNLSGHYESFNVLTGAYGRDGMLEITEEEPKRRNSDTMRHLYKKVDQLKRHKKRSDLATRSGSSDTNKTDSKLIAIPDKLNSTSTTPSIRSNNTKSTITDISLRKKTFEIDFVGGETFHVSEESIFNSRSVDIAPNRHSQLSARGLLHRPVETFMAELRNTSRTINNQKRADVGKLKPSPKLYLPYFQRGLAHERLKQVDQALSDYSKSIEINSECAEAYFNRAGLYNLKGQAVLALHDLDEAIRIDPSNSNYRNFRQLMFRQNNMYREASKEAILLKAMELDPFVAKALAAGVEVHINKTDLHKISKSMQQHMDPIVVALRVEPDKRTEYDLIPVVDFLRSCHFFQSFVSDNDHQMLLSIATNIRLKEYDDGDVIFSEGDIGDMFYIVLSGEVDIMKRKQYTQFMFEDIAVARIFAGQTFGETALETSTGKRTAGAVSRKKATQLLTILSEEYKSILSVAKSLIAMEARLTLMSAVVFKDWDDEKISYLANHATVKRFGTGKVIITEGEMCSCLYLIKSGLVRLSKQVPKPKVQSNANSAIAAFTARMSPLSVHSRAGSRHSIGFDLRSSHGGSSSNNGRLLSPIPKRSESSTALTVNSAASVQSSLTGGSASPSRGSAGRKSIYKSEQDSNTPGLWIIDGAAHHHFDNVSSPIATIVTQDADFDVGSYSSASGLKTSSNHSSSFDLDEVNDVKYVDLTVSVLSMGQIFGESSILRPARSQSPVTATANTTVDLYSFDSDLLFSMGIKFKLSSMLALEESFQLHDPPPEKLGYFYKKKYEWEKQKKIALRALKISHS